MLLKKNDNFKNLHIKILDEKIILYNINTFTTNPSLFSDLNCENIEILGRSHKICLFSFFTKRYLGVRLKSFGKMYS